MSIRNRVAKGFLTASRLLAEGAYRMTRKPDPPAPAPKLEPDGDILAGVTVTSEALGMIAKPANLRVVKPDPEPLVGSVAHRLKNR